MVDVRGACWRNYLEQVAGYCSGLEELIHNEYGLGGDKQEDNAASNLVDDALMFLTCISEDTKSRMANKKYKAPLHSQLELMAANIKSIAALVQLHYEQCEEENSADFEGEDGDKCVDRLFGWGEELCPSGETLLEDRHSIKSVACRGQRGLYVTRAGDVFSIGDNGTGMPTLATQGLEDATTPKVVGELVLERVLLGRSVVFVACGHMHSVALTQGGRLWSWGCGEYGRLGHGDDLDQPVPRLCESLLDCHVRGVGCGGAHTTVVVSPSRVFSWGLGRHGRLGLGNEKSCNTPQLVDVDDHMLAVTDAHHALFGSDVPNQVSRSRDEPIVSVVCGWAFTLLLGANGTVRAFGAGKDGQCGTENVKDQYVPVPVVELEGKNIVQISCGYHHAIAISADGSIYTWGTGGEGQLGQGKECKFSAAPKRIGNVKFKAASAVAGQFHSLCIALDGQLYGWGSNLHGAVQQSREKDILWNPKPVYLGEQHKKESSFNKSKGIGRVKHLAAGADFTIAVVGPPSKHQPGPKTVLLSKLGLSKEWDDAKVDLRSMKEKCAAAGLVSQVLTGSFCGGRVGFWTNGRFISLIGVLANTGVLELYKQLNSNSPEEVISIHGHDVEMQCKGEILEAWRTRPGQEYSLLLRVRLNSKVEAVAWAQHISKHASSDLDVYSSPSGRNATVKGRGAAWRAAIGNALRVTPELYMIYKERATRQEGIGLDVKRTLPALLLFGKSGEPLYEQLREVLEVYQCYRPDVGYVQGMSYVAAMLCLHMPNSSYECFCSLANLLASHHLFDFFRLSQAYDRVQQYYQILDLIIARTSPKLWHHVNRLGVLDEIHVTCFQWLQTLFVRRLPLEQVTLLWDAFLCRRDTMVMMRASVALLLCIRKSILAVSQPEDVLLLLRTTHRLDDFIKNTFTVVQVPHLAQEKLWALMQQYP
uniref:Rab-GAP TBC domain-containing protein n=1 Tax=Mucochytrium quahogii TaxID=96639 RepID=A0A7S2RS85_9STRA|mmetsp:Transcript_29897/g.47504  ORF Transcript_29897/g.47504 Transcript_29897/m.47504 type:complete len:931 (+) Transcript_29897:227-3019(+)